MMNGNFVFTSTKHPKMILFSDKITLELPANLFECQLMALQDFQQKIINMDIDIETPFKGRVKFKGKKVIAKLYSKGSNNKYKVFEWESFGRKNYRLWLFW